jgi:hypothetical protein
MSRYILIHRLRGPLFLLLVGVIALLAQAHILSWSRSWPLYLIFAGVLLLAERAAVAFDGGNPPAPYPGSYSAPYPGSYDPDAYAGGQPYPGAPYPGQPSNQVDPRAATGAPSDPGQTAAIVPAHAPDFNKDSNGGQS